MISDKSSNKIDLMSMQPIKYYTTKRTYSDTFEGASLFCSLLSFFPPNREHICRGLGLSKTFREPNLDKVHIPT